MPINYSDVDGYTYQLEKIRYFMLLLDSEHEIEDTNYLWYLDENDELTLVYYYGTYQNVKVPKQIEGHTVRYIAATCYNYNQNILSITIPEGIMTIG